MAKELGGIQSYGVMRIYPCDQMQPNWLVAEYLYENNVRKIPENVLGFTREEVDEISETAIKNSREKTAERFAERLKSIAKRKLELYGVQIVDIEDIDEILKEITEGDNGK